MSDERSPTNPLVKLAIELGPLIVFFVVQRTAPDDVAIFWATGVFMVAMLVSLVASRVLEGRLPAMPLITAVFVLVMGGLTLWWQDPTFIKMKPTLTNSAFALILLGGMATGRLFLKIVFAEAFELEERGWRSLTLRLGLFFVGLALLNEIVWRNFSEDAWVNFKVFGIMPLTLGFMLLQAPLLQRYAIDADGGEAADADSEDG